MTTHNEWGQFNPIHNHPDGRECSACAEWKEWKNFGLDKKMASGRRSQCRKCCALRQRDNPRTAKQNHDAYLRRKDKHGYIPNYDKAAWARSVVQAAIRRGELTRPDKCPECNESDRQIEAHHDDYDKPLEVEWICSRCHKRTKHVQY